MLRKAITTDQKIDLARTGMRAALQTRFEFGAGLEEPICIYSVCDRLGVPVRFIDVSMEGIYRPTPVPRIFLSAHRPLVRRHFNCGHELGHHIFGHGATLDEAKERAESYEDRSPDEFLVDCFAGHLLMPVLGIRNAFSRRGNMPTSASPKDILAVATEFAVGYETLVTQLNLSLRDITTTRRHELIRARPKLRRAIVPEAITGELALLDQHFTTPTLDIEINHLVVAPPGALAVNDIIVRAGETPFGPIFRAVKRGSTELFIPHGSWGATLRVAPEHFIGLARFRYLEDDE